MCFIIRTQTLQVPPHCFLSSDTVNLAIISSDNGLSTFQRQTIISTNAGLLHRCKQIYATIASKFNNRISRKWIGKWWPQSMAIWSPHDDVIKRKHFPRYWPFVRGNSPGTDEFPAQRPVTQSFGVFLDLRLNNLLSKQWWGWWFETASTPLWRHCNGILTRIFAMQNMYIDYLRPHCHNGYFLWSGTECLKHILPDYIMNMMTSGHGTAVVGNDLCITMMS